MKLIIDIPKTVYKACKEKMNSGKGGLWLESIIAKGIPYEERPKGKWLPKGRWHIDPQCIEYTCSICGRRVMREERLNVIEQYPFCHCGADMRGENA